MKQEKMIISQYKKGNTCLIFTMYLYLQFLGMEFLVILLDTENLYYVKLFLIKNIFKN